MIKISMFKKNTVLTKAYDDSEVSAQGLIHQHNLERIYSDKPDFPQGRGRKTSFFLFGQEAEKTKI
jgi:hypothetical protein